VPRELILPQGNPARENGFLLDRNGILDTAKMEPGLLPSFVAEFLKKEELEPEERCKLDDAELTATIAKQAKTTTTLEQAQVMRDFWRENYYDALHRYEAVIRPFNGWPAKEREAKLNEPLVRLHITLTEAYVTRPSYEYMAARRILSIFKMFGIN